MNMLLPPLTKSLKRFPSMTFFVAFFLFIHFCRPHLASAQTALSDPSLKGKVISLGDGHPWVVVQSTAQTTTKAGYVYIMAMYNYGSCSWGPNNSNPSYAISATSDSGSLYAILPATIGGLPKDTALGSHTWQWDRCSSANPTVCSHTLTSTSRLSFVSFPEWQGGLGGFNTEPTTGSVGNLFCQAWKGTPCFGSSIYSAFNFPWTRSGCADNNEPVWHLTGDTQYSFDCGSVEVFDEGGLLLVAWLSSSISTNGLGCGTYSSPFCLAGDTSCSPCNTSPSQPSPAPALTNSISEIGAFASYVSGYNSLILTGTASDPDLGQTLTIQYQLNSTSGAWSDLTTLVADGSNQSWSSAITLSAGLSDGSHTIYIRVYDGHDYSGNKTAIFYLDDTPPSNTASLVGGTFCTGIPTIYCTPPTGVNLSASSDNAAGIGAYRTQWAIFDFAAASPAWTTSALPPNLTTSGHTASATTHTLYYQTKDKVGNVSAVESISYYINHPPEITLNDAAYSQVITPHTPLIFSGTFVDSDLTQSVTVKVTINGVDYMSPAYPTTGSVVAWEIVIPPFSLQGLSPSQLTDISLVATDTAGASSSAYYTGQISLSSATSSEIYLSVIKNIPFSLNLGKVGAFNITYGSSHGISVSQDAGDEIIVSGALSSPISIPFGVTNLVFTVLDEPSMQVQNIEFV